MALEAAIYQHLFGHNNTSSSSSNKDDHLFPLLLEDTFFHPFLKLQDPPPLHFHDDNSSTFNNNDNDNDFYNSSYNFLDNQLDFDLHSYYNQHGIVNHENNTPPSCHITTLHDLPPLNNYDHYECLGLVNSSLSPDHQDPNPTTNNDAMEMVMRPKQRRRARVKKNKEEIENQRMTHIAVERNRRKQMNEYLNVLRSLMPDSYVQRGDQASIVGAAINFVKQLEHNLQNLSAKKQMKENLKTTKTSSSSSASSASTSSLPFQEFFTFPQFSSNYSGENHDDQLMKSGEGGGGSAMSHHQQQVDDGGELGADVEVTMVESHAHLKIRLRNPLKHLSKLVSGLHSLRLSILHLNVNTSDVGVVLYSFSLKVEDESKLSSVEEIARAVYLLLGRIKEEMSSF